MNIETTYNWNVMSAFKKTFNPALQIAMIQEEVQELSDAIETNDRQEYVDACVDIIIVALGSLANAGLSVQEIESAIYEVQKSNETKKPFILKENGKIGKGNNYIPPDLNHFSGPLY